MAHCLSSKKFIYLLSFIRTWKSLTCKICDMNLFEPSASVQVTTVTLRDGTRVPTDIPCQTLWWCPSAAAAIMNLPSCCSSTLESSPSPAGSSTGTTSEGSSTMEIVSRGRFGAY